MNCRYVKTDILQVGQENSKIFIGKYNHVGCIPARFPGGMMYRLAHLNRNTYTPAPSPRSPGTAPGCGCRT